jgi:hypothetical protein
MRFLPDVRVSSNFKQVYMFFPHFYLGHHGPIAGLYIFGIRTALHCSKVCW